MTLQAEVPPGYAGNTQQWAEDIVNYLIRNFARFGEALGEGGTGLADGTADNQSLRWDDGDQEWQATSTLQITDTGVLGCFSGTGVTQNISKFEVVAALPATTDSNTIYFVL